jgi:hypothetical protein
MEVKTLKHKLKSGNDLEVWPSKFDDGFNLLQVVSQEFSALDLSKGTVEGLSMQLMASRTLSDAMWPCLGQATYKGERINKTMFESMEARKDFIEIVKEVLVFNLGPFSENVASLCKALFQKDIAILS